MLKPEAERLNILASAAMEAYGWLPLQVRYRAAVLASIEIERWLDEAPHPAPPPFNPQYDLIGDAEQRQRADSPPS